MSAFFVVVEWVTHITSCKLALFFWTYVSVCLCVFVPIVTPSFHYFSWNIFCRPALFSFCICSFFKVVFFYQFYYASKCSQPDFIFITDHKTTSFDNDDSDDKNCRFRQRWQRIPQLIFIFISIFFLFGYLIANLVKCSIQRRRAKVGAEMRMKQTTTTTIRNDREKFVWLKWTRQEWKSKFQTNL